MTPPADTADSAAPPRVPWWRHRRRLFWIAVTLAALGLPWGGWVWWYRAYFPMPPTPWLASFGIDPGPVDDWLNERRWELSLWKIYRETRLLDLAGSSWENTDYLVKLTFGRDGRLRVENPPRMGGVTPYSEWFDILPSLHGSRYEFDPRVEISTTVFWLRRRYTGGFIGHTPNLNFPDSPWHGLLHCEPDRRQIAIYLWPKAQTTGLPLHFVTFTRVPDR